MRPWTLNPSSATDDNPLLSELGVYTVLEGYSEHALIPAESVSANNGGDGEQTTLDASSPRGSSEATSAAIVKRRRITHKLPIRKTSYAATWEKCSVST